MIKKNLKIRGNNKIDKIRIDKLLKIVSEIFKINNLSWNGCLNGIQLSRHKDRTNVLDKICYKYFGNYKYQNKMRVYQLCRRKSKEFVDILNKDMKNSNYLLNNY